MHHCLYKPKKTTPNKHIDSREKYITVMDKTIRSIVIKNIYTGCSLTSFKHKLDKYLQNIPDKPKIPGYTIETDTNSEEFPRKLSNTAEAESLTWPERLYS